MPIIIECRAPCRSHCRRPRIMVSDDFDWIDDSPVWHPIIGPADDLPSNFPFWWVTFKSRIETRKIVFVSIFKMGYRGDWELCRTWEDCIKFLAVALLNGDASTRWKQDWVNSSIREIWPNNVEQIKSPRMSVSAKVGWFTRDLFNDESRRRGRPGERIDDELNAKCSRNWVAQIYRWRQVRDIVTHRLLQFI